MTDQRTREALRQLDALDSWMDEQAKATKVWMYVYARVHDDIASVKALLVSLPVRPACIGYPTSSVRGRRTSPKGGKPGMFVGRDDADEKGHIFDMDGKLVANTYDYHDVPHSGCVVVQEPQ